MQRLKRSIVLTALLATSFSRAADFIPVFNAALQAGGSALVGSQQTGVALGRFMGTPVFKLSDTDLLLPVMMFNVTGQQNAIEEQTFFAQSAMGIFKPMLNHKFSPEVSAKFRLQAKESL